MSKSKKDKSNSKRNKDAFDNDYEEDNNKNKNNIKQDDIRALSNLDYIQATVQKDVQEGLLKVAREKPDNPIYFLGEYLYDVNTLPGKIDDTRDSVKAAKKEISEILNKINTSILLAGGKWSEALQVGGLTGKDIQNYGGLTAAQTQKAINKAGANQNRMAGVEVTGGVSGKNNKGKKVTAKSGHINKTGTKVAASQGDDVYFQNWDKDKGAVTGTVSSVDVNNDNLKLDTIKSNKAEFKEAFEYAIQHQAPGTKINKNMKSIVSLFGWAGKTFKLSNGRTGSMGNDGALYYNTAKGNVRKWNLTKAQDNTVIKYSQSKYLANAKKNNNTSREYAQALITRKAYTKKQLQGKGVKKFAAGGLANYTGPAWLDGTPSKPELVLDSNDTRNFLMLRDTLSKAVSGTKSILNDNNTTYDIDINVDHIANDYDVDRIADRVKKQITQSAGYRNVTAVRHLR